MHTESEAGSVAGLIHKLVTGYVVRGYVHFVAGRHPKRIPTEKLHEIDEKFVAKYGANVSRNIKASRKAAGYYNVQYMRFRRDWVMVATPGLMGAGTEDFFEEHIRTDQLRNFTRDCFQFHGYSIGFRPEGGRPKVEGRVRVAVTKGTKRRGAVRMRHEIYMGEKKFIVDKATSWAAEQIVEHLQALANRWICYAPIRGQIKSMLQAANQARKLRGFRAIPWNAIDFRLPKGVAFVAGPDHLEQVEEQQVVDLELGHDKAA